MGLKWLLINDTKDGACFKQETRFLINRIFCSADPSWHKWVSED